MRIGGAPSTIKPPDLSHISLTIRGDHHDQISQHKPPYDYAGTKTVSVGLSAGFCNKTGLWRIKVFQSSKLQFEKGLALKEPKYACHDFLFIHPVPNLSPDSLVFCDIFVFLFLVLLYFCTNIAKPFTRIINNTDSVSLYFVVFLYFCIILYFVYIHPVPILPILSPGPSVSWAEKKQEPERSGEEEKQTPICLWFKKIQNVQNYK